MNNYQKYKELIEKYLEQEYDDYVYHKELDFDIYSFLGFASAKNNYIKKMELKYPIFKYRITREFINDLKEKNNGK